MPKQMAHCGAGGRDEIARALAHDCLPYSVLRKDPRDLRALTGDRQGKGEQQAGFLRVQVVGDEKATLRDPGALESSATAGPRRLHHYDAATDCLLERLKV